MLRSFTYLFLFLASTVIAHAQTDTIYSITRYGIEARFAFKKAANLTQVRSYAPVSFPVYSMTRTQHNRIRDLLYNFVAMETNFDSLRRNQTTQDSLFRLKESTWIDAYQKQELRAKNFEDSYNKLLNINGALDADLKKCEKLAQDEHRKRKRKSIAIGALSAAVGFLIGAAAL